jgi:DNA-binding MurR/RpiR family transcriptional regulator
VGNIVAGESTSLEIIRQNVAAMTPAERAIAQYIISNQASVVYLTARQLAEQAGVSDASVVRFCQSLGYSGFKELRLRIALAAQASEPYARHADSDVSIESKVAATCERAIATIRKTQSLLSIEMLMRVARKLPGASFCSASALPRWWLAMPRSS